MSHRKHNLHVRSHGSGQSNRSMLEHSQHVGKRLKARFIKKGKIMEETEKEGWVEALLLLAGVAAVMGLLVLVSKYLNFVI